MINLLTSNFGSFLAAFGYTVLSSILALIASLILGTLFAILQVVKNRFVNVIAQIYVEVFSKYSSSCYRDVFLFGRDPVSRY
ncbi:hypothetical protein Q757_05350 [Oenococcus alcoholitolerans]|uniref:ABC transmembrane type-1 domain-containing protein n=1 Tax=Oenococcus alcoholitolerans TaxID=931074 RepID=A0ABR4XQK7_9LACO|nr:hypothetical protein Q757_05350 [Oenococcus alcoholitolerans]